MHTFHQTVVICVTGMCLFTGAITQAQDQLAKRAEAILRSHCYDCHGLDGTAEGGLNFILDARRMVKRRLVIPGDAVRSKLYRQVKSGSMPKDLDPLTSTDSNFDSSAPSSVEFGVSLLTSFPPWITARSRKTPLRNDCKPNGFRP